ncbi:uncharacterized protein LOC105641871 [Jatropha curcas]|uniref:uncharacterized protein LOC105641871 n=1 Tax=Jatropha curcas TaxID=180498 RepID=UPI0005FBC4F9|nr:uncharacterized protein LOC105641871 [Jatropha curcas]
MENSQIVREGKLGFFGIIKESLRIPFKNPNFIIFAFLTSLPLFCFSSVYEIIFQKTIIETRYIIQETITPDNPYGNFEYSYEALLNFEKWIGKISRKFLLLVLFYLGILHFLDLLNTVAVVEITSLIYKEEKAMNLKAMFSRFINETRLKGPLITSIYVLLLASLISFGLVSLLPYILIGYTAFFFTVPFLVLYISLLIKYIDWSAIWDMGIVISVLEEKQGDVAIIASSYLSRGSRLYGFFLMLVFFGWRVALRLSLLYAGFKTGGGEVMRTVLQSGFICFGVVLKWVIFVVYFYDCKKQSLEGKIDAEEGIRRVEQ